MRAVSHLVRYVSECTYLALSHHRKTPVVEDVVWNIVPLGADHIQMLKESGTRGAHRQRIRRQVGVVFGAAVN